MATNRLFDVDNGRLTKEQLVAKTKIMCSQLNEITTGERFKMILRNVSTYPYDVMLINVALHNFANKDVPVSEADYAWREAEVFT